MITLYLFLVGLLSLFFFSPELTAFYYTNQVDAVWFFRLITHMVSHGDIFHLLGNFTFGLPFMLYAEYILKSHKAFLKLFLYTGLVALLGQRIAELYSPVQVGAVIGSSGAIFGIMGFALVSFQGPKLLKLLAWGAVAFHAYNQGMLAWYSMKGMMFAGVAFAAHFAGLLAGVAIALILYRRHRRRPCLPTGRQRQSRFRK
jgi:membrane associated rhomboid family serine protease